MFSVLAYGGRSILIVNIRNNGITKIPQNYFAIWDYVRPDRLFLKLINASKSKLRQLLLTFSCSTILANLVLVLSKCQKTYRHIDYRNKIVLETCYKNVNYHSTGAPKTQAQLRNVTMMAVWNISFVTLWVNCSTGHQSNKFEREEREHVVHVHLVNSTTVLFAPNTYHSQQKLTQNITTVLYK